MNYGSLVLKLFAMINKQTILKSLILILIVSNNVSAEVICDPDVEIEAQSVKLGPTQKQNKTIESETMVVKDNKNTKSDNIHFSILKLLIPGGLR